MQEEVALAQVARVPGAKPAHAGGILAGERLRGRLRVRPVALHVLRGADPHLADLALGAVLAARGIHHAQLDPGDRLSGRAQQVPLRPARGRGPRAATR